MAMRLRAILTDFFTILTDCATPRLVFVGVNAFTIHLYTLA